MGNRQDIKDLTDLKLDSNGVGGILASEEREVIYSLADLAIIKGEDADLGAGLFWAGDVLTLDSHNHAISEVTDLQTALDAKLASASYTAADVLTKIKTVDGAASGLDADLLDGISSAGFAPIAHVGAGGTAHAIVIAGGAAGFISGAQYLALIDYDDFLGATKADTSALGSLAFEDVVPNASLAGAYNAVTALTVTSEVIRYVVDATHYGVLSLQNNSSVRGAYLGWGNAGTEFDFTGDNASILNFAGWTTIDLGAASLRAVGASVIGGGASSLSFMMDTADAADTKALFLAGGGAVANTRSAVLLLYGNEHATQAGVLYLQAGTTGNVKIAGDVALTGELSNTGKFGGFLWGTKAWNPGSLIANALETTTVTVTGAAVGDTVVPPTLSTATQAGWVLLGRVSSANTVTVTLINFTGGTLDLASGTLNVMVLRAP